MGIGVVIGQRANGDPGRLVGRDALLAEAVGLLADPAVRLLTLSGAGGVGKTTLARAIAGAAIPTFQDGIAFVELADERDPHRLLVAAVQALGLDLIVGEPPLATLVRGLRGSRLIVLDNLEQLLAGTSVLAELLTACPDLTVLATSRTRLGLALEHELPVPPLALPGRTTVPAGEIADSPAVQLFLRRAQRVNGAFTLSPGNAATVAEICRRLDGLPLALELGAARMNLLSVEALLARLDARLDLLSSGPRDVPARHRSMRDAVAWSVELLEPAERRLFAIVSVFVGGCTAQDLAAVVEAIGVGGGESPVDVRAAAEALLAGSLVQTTTDSNGDPRLAMLESIRDVAAERLDRDGLTWDARRGHAGHYLTVAERDGPLLRSDTVTQNRMWERLHADIGNLRAALAWFLEAEDATGGLRLVTGLDWFWTASHFLMEEVAWIERLVAVAAAGPAVPSEVWGNAHRLLALLMDWLGNGDETERAVRVAIAALSASAAYGPLVEVLSIAANAALEGGRLGLARERCERVLALADETDPSLAGVKGIEVIAGNTGLILGLVLALQGETAAAAERVMAAIDRYRRAGEVGYIPAALDTLAFVHLRGDAPSTALTDLAAALEAARASAGEAEGEGQFLQSIFASIAQLAQRSGEAAVAARMFSAAETERRRTGVPTRKPLQRLIDVDIDLLRTELSEARFQAEWAIGAAASQAEQIELAARFLRDALSPPLTGRLRGLTPRELDVLRLVMAGRSNREIGDALYISSQTASKHVSNLLAKLGLATRTAAATYAAEHGLRPGARYTPSSG